MSQSRNAIGNLLNRYKAVLVKNRLLNTFGTLALSGAVLLGGAGMAQAVPGTQDDWNKLFQTSSTIINAVIPGTGVYTHAEGRDPAQLLTMHGSWTVENNAIVNGQLSLGNPDAPAYMPGSVTVQNDSTLTVTGGLISQGDLNLGESLDAGIGKNGTLILQGATKDSASLNISGSVTVGRDGGGVNVGVIPTATVGDGDLQLSTGIATIGGDLTVGGSSANVSTPLIVYEIVAQGPGGTGKLTVGKDAELHMQEGSSVKFGGDASNGTSLPFVGTPTSAGFWGGSATVESSGTMHLGQVTMGGNGGSAGDAFTVAPGLPGGKGGSAALTLHKGSVTVMSGLTAGGAGGDGGDGGQFPNTANAPLIGQGGFGGFGGSADLDVKGSLAITGDTVIGASHGSNGSDGPATPSAGVPPTMDPGGWYGFGGMAGKATMKVTDGGELTLGSKVTITSNAELPDFNPTDLRDIAQALIWLAASHSYIEIGEGGTLKLTDSQSRDLVYSSYLLGAHKGLDAGSLISSGSSGTILFDGGTVEGKDLSASEGLELSTGKVNAHVVTDRFTIGTFDDKQSVTIKDGLSLTITGSSEYLLSSADTAVNLNGGTLNVGGNIALLNATDIRLLKAGYGGTNQNVKLAGAGNSVITQGTAVAGDADVDIAGGNSLTAKVLDTTVLADGTSNADGKNVTVRGKSSLHLTQDVAQGSVIKLGNTGALLVNESTLKLTGNVAMGALDADATGNTTVASLSGVQQNTAANTITFSNGSTLDVSGVLSYGKALTVANAASLAGADAFIGTINAGGIHASSLHVDNSQVALRGFADAGQNFLSGAVLVDNGGKVTLGGVEGQGGSSSATIAVSNGSLVLAQGNFSTGKITLDDDTARINIGDTKDIGQAGSLQANVDLLKGALDVHNTATDGLYTIKGDVAVKNAAEIIMTAGNLKVDGALNYETTKDLLINNKNLAVGTLNLAAQTVRTGTGTLEVAALRSTGEATVDLATGTLDLVAQNITDLSKMGAATKGGAVDGYAGSFSVNDSTVKTTGTVSYINDAALNLHKQAGASSATAFNGALEAGMLEAKTSAGALQSVNVSGQSLTLYGTGTSFLNVDSLTVNSGGTVQLGGKEYAPGGTSASHVALAGGTLAVKGGMYAFSADKAFSTSATSNVNIDDGGVLAFTGQAVADSLANPLNFVVGGGLQSDASATAGTLLFANTAGLSQANVNLDIKKGAAVMGGTGTMEDLRWVSDTLTKWGINAPAILAISGANTIDLTGSTLKVGGDGNNHFGDNSLTMVDVTNFDLTKPALKVSGDAVSFGKDARLLITGKLVDGKQHSILLSDAGFTATDIKDTWSVVKDPNRLVSVTTDFDSNNKSIIANVAVGSPQESMTGLSNSLGGLMQAMARDPNFGFDVQSNNAGVRFLSRTAHADYIADGKAAAATAEGATQMAAVGNVAGSTIGASTGASTNANTRMSFSTGNMDTSKATALYKDTDGNISLDSGLSAGDGLKNGVGLWLMPMYQHNTTWGMKSGEFKTGGSSDLFGISLGADYTFAEAFRFGLALNMGGGNGTSNGDFNPTDTRFNYWGLSLYGGWVKDNFGLSADVGYTSNFNAITQELPQGMGMSDLKADVNSSAWTAGLRGEYKFATSVMDIIPHIGVRYTGMTAESYSVESAGQTVFDVDQSHQSLWTFPVGVTFAKPFETSSGWSITPSIDLGIVAAAGDLKAKSSTRIPGLNATAEMETQVVDGLTFDGGLGMEVKNDAVSFGLNYNIQASEHRTGHGLFGTIRYEF